MKNILKLCYGMVLAFGFSKISFAYQIFATPIGNGHASILFCNYTGSTITYTFSSTVSSNTLYTSGFSLDNQSCQYGAFVSSNSSAITNLNVVGTQGNDTLFTLAIASIVSEGSSFINNGIQTSLSFQSITSTAYDQYLTYLNPNGSNNQNTNNDILLNKEGPNQYYTNLNFGVTPDYIVCSVPTGTNPPAQCVDGNLPYIQSVSAQ